MLVDKSNRKHLKDEKAIPCKLQHRLVVTDRDKRKLEKVVKNERTIRKIWKVKENNMRTRFQGKTKELADVDVPNL